MVAPTVALVGALAVGSAQNVAWTDAFGTFNSSIWTQQTDVEHCSDGACFAARVDRIRYGAGGLQLDLNKSPCNVTKADCCVGSKCATWASGHLASVDATLYGT
jgi:hypothetical protein